MFSLHRYVIIAVIFIAVSVLSPASLVVGGDSTPSRFKVSCKEGRLSVTAEQASLPLVLGEIVNQTGLEIRGGAVPATKISATFSNVSLREGLRDLLGPINYALLEKARLKGQRPLTRLVLVLLSQGSAKSIQVGSGPKPSVIASNDARTTTSDDAARQDHSQAAHARAAQQEVSGALVAKLPPALPDEGAEMTANQPAPAILSDQGVAMVNRRSAPAPIPDNGINLDFQSSKGGIAQMGSTGQL